MVMVRKRGMAVAILSFALLCNLLGSASMPGPGWRPPVAADPPDPPAGGARGDTSGPKALPVNPWASMVET